MKVGIFTKTILSLRGKVMLVVAAGMAFAFAALALVVFETEHRLIESHLVHTYRETTKSFAAIISHSIRTLDFKMLQEILDHKAKEENIRYILVQDSAGKTIARAGDWKEEFAAHAGDESENRQVIPGGAREVRAPHSLLHGEGHVFEVDEKIPDLEIAGDWTVHIGVDTVRANQEVIANTKRIVLLAGIVLAASLTTMFFIDQRLRRIFRELITVTCRMASGDRLLRVNIRTGDELQILGESFNSMANVLREKEEQVRSYAETLEARVRERTQELFAEKQKLGAILGAIRAGLILYAPGPKTVWMNDIVQEWLHGPDALPPPMKEDLFQGYGGVESIARRVLQEKVALEAEKQVDDPSGEVSYFQIFATPITTEEDDSHQALLLLLNVSEKRRLERRLRQAEKMVAIGELAGGVAHEINTPVGVVIAKTEFLLERLRERVKPKDIEDLDKILKNAKRIAVITRGLLSFSRESGAMQKDVAINALIEETILLLVDRLKTMGVQLETSLAPDLPAISANPDELQQVLLNLFSNALDAMGGKNGIKRLQISTALEDSCIAIRVTDTGIGIPPALKERIFDPFFSTKGVGKGTGLGLSISLGIARAHGGQILVESKVNEWSTFTVKLPIGAEATIRDAGS